MQNFIKFDYEEDIMRIIKYFIVISYVFICSDVFHLSQFAYSETELENKVSLIMQRVDDYPFNPIVDGFSKEPKLNNTDGVSHLADTAWKVRLLAIRDLVRLGEEAVPEIVKQLEHGNPNVRHVAAFVLGLRPGEISETSLMNLLKSEVDPVVRSQAAISLGRLNSKNAIPLLQDLSQNDQSRDVRHQCELAVYRIKHFQGADDELAESYASLDELDFNLIQVGQPAIDFELQDAEGKTWKLSDFKGKKEVVLIWIFADWCPVCHNEFRELIQLKEEYEKQNIQVFTIECHDKFRCRVMVGKEFQPTYWFSKISPQGFYQGKTWWPHLVDLAGAVGAMYGVQPMEFVVHSEWINRPSTVIVDKEGIVRFAYYGTFWGDRPSIKETLEMMESDQFEFEHPKRLKP